jgi:hypothetical protein
MVVDTTTLSVRSRSVLGRKMGTDAASAPGTSGYIIRSTDRSKDYSDDPVTELKRLNESPLLDRASLCAGRMPGTLNLLNLAIRDNVLRLGSLSCPDLVTPLPGYV